ncbi:MAG: PAS domain S-box protein, partial [Anaerolineaceae bacterium]|nr:PAS domain S-box protein [Anaerolineaceae bacterium]
GNALEYQCVGRDITERKRGEEALQKAHDELDLKVEKRTADLTMANEALQCEIAMRKRTEKALKSERDFSTTILSTADALVTVLDLQGRIVTFNQACEACSGYSSEEVLGRPFWDFLLLPEEKDLVKAIFAELAANALPKRFENSWVTKDGCRRLIAWSNSVLTDSAGSVEFVVATGVDITARRQAEEELKSYHDHLETMVDKRTVELEETNEQLQREIAERTEMEEALLESETRFRALSDAAFEGIGFSEQGRFIDANQQLVNMLGYELDELKGMDVRELVLPEDREFVQNMIMSGSEVPYEHRSLRKDGTIIFIEVRPRMMSIKGQPMRVTAIRDITERKRNEAALQESERRYRLLITEMYNGFALHEIIVDESGVPFDYRFLEVNPAFERLTGLLGAEIIGKTILKVLPQTEPYWIDTYGKVALTGKPIHYENYAQEFEKTFEVLAYSPKKGQFATVFTDVTARKQAELRLQHLATHDILTDLPNRLLFFEHLQHGLALAKRQQYQLALLFLDLDDFKTVNDTYGHDIGDQLLKAVGERMKASVRESDQVARLAGDEFIVLLENLSDVKSAAVLADKILIDLCKPFALEGHRITITTSIGISIYPNDGDEPEILLKKADEAMYMAKRQGKNRYCFSA